MMCDGCNDGYHIYCVSLPDVPEVDWYCSKCQKENNKNENQNQNQNKEKQDLEKENSSIALNRSPRHPIEKLPNILPPITKKRKRVSNKN